MTIASRYIYALTFAITATGFLLPFWPLCIVGILIATLSGRYVFGILIALLIDVGSGIPTGIVHYLFVPFTILAILATLIRVFAVSYFLDKTPPDTL